jgi:hypothetical protein
VGGLSSSELLVDGGFRQGWWLVVDEEGGPARIVAGPFADRAEAGWAAGDAGLGGTDGVHPVYGIRRPDGVLNRRPSPQDWAWLAHLAEQLERLPEDWAEELTEDDPLTTLVVEVTAALSEAGLLLHDAVGSAAVGGACLTPEPGLGGVVVTWRQHERMSVDQVHGPVTDALVQQVLNHAVADVLRLRGFTVEAFGGASGHVVRMVA